MEVALLAFTPEPELTIAAAARLSASAVGARELSSRLKPDRVASLLDQLVASGHLSPFEHVSFTFAIDGISRVTSHQLVRHRIASFTQQSQRYVSLREMGFVTPATIKANPTLHTEYQEAVRAAHQLYCRMLDSNIPAEDARYVLPNAAETNLVMTMNARELIHACSLRLCERAQWEIVALFGKIKAEVERVAPRIAAELNPKCYKLGYCDERQSCGLFPLKGQA